MALKRKKKIIISKVFVVKKKKKKKKKRKNLPTKTIKGNFTKFTTKILGINKNTKFLKFFSQTTNTFLIVVVRC